MTKYITIFFLIYFNLGLHSQVTYTKDIATIIYNNCTVCHRSGEIAPFSLTNYQEVKDKANLIKLVTEIRYMPPWQADPEYSHLLGENALTEEQIELIAEWVDGGTVYGNEADEPLLPEFPSGSSLGEPDLVLEFAEAHLHPGNNKDEYRYFVIPTNLEEDKVLKAIELRPGNTQIVHHALFFEDKSGTARSVDEGTPEYGFDAFNNEAGFGIEQVLLNNQYPGYVPGQKPRFYPDGLGQKLSAGTDLVIQMHYAPWPKDELDKSKINLFFADEDETIERFVSDHVMLPLPGTLLNGPFIINAGQEKTFHGVWELREDISLIGLSPHMHLLGKDWTIWMEDLQGNKTNLISIPDWDFNWQGMYYFPRFIIGKKGYKIHARATYDNTSSNPFNPSVPPRTVSWGESTTDEMYYLPLLYVDYKSGDEEIIFDTTLVEEEPEIGLPSNKIFAIWNNLNSNANPMVPIGFRLNQGKSINIQVIDGNGRLVRTIRRNEFFEKGEHIVYLNTNSLLPGMYFININGNDLNLSEKFVKID